MTIELFCLILMGLYFLGLVSTFFDRFRIKGWAFCALLGFALIFMTMLPSSYAAWIPLVWILNTGVCIFMVKFLTSMEA